jgi:hypothetical protein
MKQAILVIVQACLCVEKSKYFPLHANAFMFMRGKNHLFQYVQVHVRGVQ